MRKSIWGWLALSVLVFVLDQISKLYFESLLEASGSISVIPDLLSWHLAYNTGAAFSFLADAAGWQRWFFALIAILASTILVLWLNRLKPGETRTALSLALILGGAIGNLFDRVAYGHVIDFILVHWRDTWYFPAFNLADSAITIGAILLALDIFFPHKQTHV